MVLLDSLVVGVAPVVGVARRSTFPAPFARLWARLPPLRLVTAPLPPPPLLPVAAAAAAAAAALVIGGGGGSVGI